MAVPFEPPPAGVLPAKPAPVGARTYFGVRLPRLVPFYDTRIGDDQANPKADYGETLWSSERARYALGLRLSYTEQYDTTPVGCQFYFDSRRPEVAHETARVLVQMRKALAEVWWAYRKARRNRARPGAGGSCRVRPVGCALSNYGWDVIGDERTTVVESLERV